MEKRLTNSQTIVIFWLCFDCFSIYLAASAAKYCEKGFGRYKNWRGWIDKPILELLTFGQKVANFVNAGFWRLRAPETSIWAPEGAFWPKKAIFPSFFHYFFAGFRAVNLNFPSFFAGARAWARGLRRRMENVFFSARVFQAVNQPQRG